MTEKQCQRCGKQLSPDVLGGLCPACLMTVGDSATTAGMGKTFDPPAPGELAPLFPALEIIELLGRGGMGAVYKARQPKLDRYVALKLLTRVKDPKISEAEFAARFQQEARALARLAHPDIVAVHDFGQAGGYHYLIMEYVDGVTLRQLLRTQKLPPEQALQIVPKICEALQFAHERGIVHRDIKPENILLDKEGRVKIADFGIAKIVEAETGGAALTGAKDVIGTPHYMAPEQVEHPQTVDHRADIYSLGVVFYEMLTGELPLGKFQPPSKKVQVDVRLDEVVLHTLEKEPERRYQHASEVKSDVETIVTGGAKSEVRSSKSQTKARSEVHWVVPSAVSAVVFYAALVAGVALIYALPFGGRLNLALVAVLVAALPIMVVFVQRWVRRASADERVIWLRAWAWMGWLLAVPVVGFGLFFLHAFLASTGGWNPAPDEAVMVPLTWLGSLALPVAGLVLLRACGVSKPRLWWVGLASVLVAVAVMAGLYASDVYRHRAFKEQLAREVQQLQQQQAKAGAPGLPEPSSIQQEAFSPVIERELPDPDNGSGRSNRETLRLRTGERLSVLDDAPKESGGRLRALAASEGDLFAEYDDFVGGRWALITAGLKFADLLPRQWETATPAELDEALRQPSALQRTEHSGAELYLLPEGLLPLTFALESRHGERGLLQITGFTDNPRGVKIRYKLAQLPVGGGGGGRATAESPDLVNVDDDAVNVIVPNRYLAAALAGMDLAAEKAKEAAARGELSEQANVFNHFNELCDQLQGKNQNAPVTPQDWGIQDADKFRTITDSLAALEDASERMRDIARSSRRSIAEREPILKEAANQFVNRYAEFKAQLHIATRSGGMSAASQNARRKFVRLVADKTALTFEGQPTSWDGVGTLLANVPDRKNTVLEFAVTSDQITVAQQNEWFQKATALARQHGFEYASFIGIHPLGSKVTSSSSARGVPPFAQAEPGGYRVGLPNGLTVEVVALTSTPRAGLAWWRPNGALLTEPPGDRLGELSGLCPSGKSSVEFAVLFDESGKAAPERVLLFEPLPQYVDATELFKGHQSAGAAAVIGYRTTPENLTCKFGVADGPEERVATWDGAGTLLSNETGGPLQLVRSGADNETCLRLQHQIDPNQFNVRLAARLKNGEHKLARVCRVEYGSEQRAQVCALIQGMQDADVVAYELYRVPLRWAAIPGLATKPTVPPIRGSAAAFGTVIERTLLGLNESRTNCFIDFETGKLIDPPVTLALTNRAAVWAWTQLQGVDAVAMTRQETRGLLGYELTAGPMRDKDWETATSEQVSTALTKARFNNVRFPSQDPLAQAVLSVNTVSTSTDQPRTYAFRTQEGSSGMLQFLSYTDAPRGSVKVRYKLLNLANAAESLPQKVRQSDAPAAVTISNLIASENWGEMMKLFPQAIRRTDKANAVEGAIQTNTPILLEWDMSLPMAFVTGMEKRPMPEFKPGSWLEFTPDSQKAVAHLRFDPWPHAAWRFHLEILDDGGKIIQQPDHVLENTGRRPPKRQWTVEQSEFSFALGRGVLDRGKRFRLSVESLWTEQEGEFQFGVELPLYFGLSTVDYTGMFRAQWVKVDATNAGAVVRARVAEWPKSKWRLRLELLDSQGQPAGDGQGVAENVGWIISRVATGERDFRFPVKNLGSGPRAPQRFRLRLEALSDASNRSDAAVRTPTSWTVVCERDLATHLFASENRVLDLDTGQVLSVPNENALYVRTNGLFVQNHPRALYDWLVKARADLFATDARHELNLHLDDGWLAPLTDRTNFEQVTTSELEHSLPKQGISQSTTLQKTNAGAVLFAFRTREGGRGLLQITGFTDNPRGVKIRYKLVQTADSGDASQTSPGPARRVIAQAPFSARLAEGEVELVALSYYPSTNEPWWAPDGGAAKEGPFVTEASGDSSAEFRMFAIVARLRDVPAAASQPAWKVEPRNTWAQGKVLPPDEKADGKLVMISCKQPRSAVSANVKVGIASGAWETVARARAGAVNPGAQPGPEGSAMFLPLADTEGGVRVSVTHDYRDMELRLIAVESDGSLRVGASLEQSLSGTIGHTTMTFPGFSLKQAVPRRTEFQLQGRPYHWVEFHNVSLKPGPRTQVEVRDAVRN